MAKLTEKQKRFIGYYLELGNATEAAIKAGYSPKTARSMGQENLTKPDIKKYIEEQLNKMEDERIASASEVLKYLTSVMRGERTEEIIVVEGIGEGCSEARSMNKTVGAREQLKAAELLGKRFQLFTDKVEVSGAIPVVIKDDIIE